MILTNEDFLKAIFETLQMVSISLIIGSIVGVILGIMLALTGRLKNKYNKIIFNIASFVINIIRSIPFIILLIAIVPLTRAIVGTSIGTKAAIVPLILYISPYIARLVENSLLEVDSGIIEAANAMGASTFELVWYFLLPEALASLILALTTATIGLIGATAMAGSIGGGGVGDLAISYGYERFDTTVIIITVIILVIFVQVVQWSGNYLSKKIRRN